MIDATSSQIGGDDNSDGDSVWSNSKEEFRVADVYSRIICFLQFTMLVHLTNLVFVKRRQKGGEC